MHPTSFVAMAFKYAAVALALLAVAAYTAGEQRSAKPTSTLQPAASRML